MECPSNTSVMAHTYVTSVRFEHGGTAAAKKLSGKIIQGSGNGSARHPGYLTLPSQSALETMKSALRSLRIQIISGDILRV